MTWFKRFRLRIGLYGVNPYNHRVYSQRETREILKRLRLRK